MFAHGVGPAGACQPKRPSVSHGGCSWLSLVPTGAFPLLAVMIGHSRVSVFGWLVAFFGAARLRQGAPRRSVHLRRSLLQVLYCVLPFNRLMSTGLFDCYQRM